MIQDCAHLHRVGFRAALVALVALAITAGPTTAHAHPGSGIVLDRQGTVYFVVYGTNRIMRVSRDGVPSVLVDDERLRLPHHLVLTPDGTLYSASDFDGKVWRIAMDGSLHLTFDSNVLPRSAPGYPTFAVGAWGDPFTIDADGMIYALGPSDRSTIVRIAPDGNFTRVASDARFDDLHFRTMAFGPSGVLHLSDGMKIWRIVDDRAVAITPPAGSLRNAAGIAVDSAGRIWIADYGSKRVVRLGADGRVDTPREIRRLRLIRPVGVAVYGDAVYVLDNPPGGVVVWRVADDGVKRVYVSRGAGILASALVLLLLSVLIVAQTWRRRPRGLIDWGFWTLPTGFIVFAGAWLPAALPLAPARILLALAFVAAAWRSWPRTLAVVQSPAPPE